LRRYNRTLERPAHHSKTSATRYTQNTTAEKQGAITTVTANTLWAIYRSILNNSGKSRAQLSSGKAPLRFKAGSFLKKTGILQHGYVIFLSAPVIEKGLAGRWRWPNAFTSSRAGSKQCLGLAGNAFTPGEGVIGKV
jgi:hypothetical protein